jgi:hypothetical protein
MLPSSDNVLSWYRTEVNIQAIPFQAGQLDFVSYARQIELLKPANLALLGGLLSIKQFSFSATDNPEDAYKKSVYYRHS